MAAGCWLVTAVLHDGFEFVIPELPEPTMAFVLAKIKQFDDDNSFVESGLTKLIGCFPRNEDLADVLIKVATINSLYSKLIMGR